jgi:deferrochelatase/peroxidase EfeB
MGSDPEKSRQLTSLHRMLRRGRIYGSAAPVAWFPTTLPRDSTTVANASKNRGLLFVSLCADLARQFEFVQQTWLNNPKHGGRFDEVDPIAAGDAIVGDENRFYIPRDPVRLRLAELKRWVTVNGGGYFLLPSRKALQLLL